MKGETITYIIIICVLVIMSGYFSATETAFSSLNKTKLRALSEKGNRRAALAYRLSEQYDKLISTILIGNNIVNISLASIGTVMFVKLYGDVGATISTAVITVVVLVFGEVTPKSLAKDNPDGFSLFSAPIINVFIILLTPLNFLFTVWKKLISKIIKVKADNKMSHDELLMLVEEVQEEGSIDDNEGELLRNAIEFNDTEAKEILTHRVEIASVEVNDTKESIANIFTETKFSRILVYDENIDNIVGVIHLKDFYVGTGITDKDIKDIMTPPIYINESAKLDDILNKLQKDKAHIAVVVDEYGGTKGIVTMEDILEELVGDIWDEHDEVVENFIQTGENTYSFEGTAEMSEVMEFFDFTTETEANSVGGWVTELLGRMAETGDCVEYENLFIKVEEADLQRILKVSIKQCSQSVDTN
ncbi:MAG: HlyC/CorC family transporter [Ruminococcaceae bacterium]|nr:HlyC/CorC family transporter [Oscillospiraceae bacterium]